MKNNELIEKRLKFLNETIEYYSSDTTRIATNEHGACKYKTIDNKKCAIGRHIPNDQYKELMEGHSVNNSLIQNAIPDEIKNLGIDFLISIQNLHDNKSCWGINCLTPIGINYVENIKKRFCTQQKTI